MRVKLIKLGSIITLCNGIYAIVYGILVLIFHKIILSEYFFRTVFAPPMKWDIFSESFPYRARLYFTLLLTNAFFIISLGIFIAYLSYFILKRKDKLAWIILFLGGIISWASFFIINIMVGSWIVRVLSFIGWASFIIGMTIPIKYYIGKRYPKF